MAVAAAVGEAFLSAFIEVVLDRLASPDVVDFIRGKKVDVNLVQRLKNTLYAVEAVLNDAEQKQFKDSAVNKWLDDLKDAVYVADDILDHISTKAATSWKKKEVSTINYFSRFFNFEEREREIWLVSWKILLLDLNTFSNSKTFLAFNIFLSTTRHGELHPHL
ncbi:hypothetical protein P8452_11673 [Trifolium repens]|nr:hypothetical protein P8452_11673 [Trifolium repens]